MYEHCSGCGVASGRVWAFCSYRLCRYHIVRFDASITDAVSATLTYFVAANFDVSRSALPLVQWRFPLGVMRGYATGRLMSRLAVQRCCMPSRRGVHMHYRNRCFSRVHFQLTAFVAVAIIAFLASAVSAAVAAIHIADVARAAAASAFTAVSRHTLSD